MQIKPVAYIPMEGLRHRGMYLFIITHVVLHLLGARYCTAQTNPQIASARFHTFLLQRFTINEGLTQGLVRSIVQDREGYMWFATKDGLDKYDGYKVTVYLNDPKNPYALPDNHVSALLEDPLGNLWVGTNNGGLCLFDPHTDRFFPVPALQKGSDFYEEVGNIQYRNGLLYLNVGTGVQILDVDKVAPGNYLEQIKFIKPVFSANNFKYGNHGIFFNFLLLEDNGVLITNKDSLFILKQTKYHSFDLIDKFSRTQSRDKVIHPYGAVYYGARRTCYLPKLFNTSFNFDFLENMLGPGFDLALPGFKDSAGNVWGSDGIRVQFLDSARNSLDIVRSTDDEINGILKSVISLCVDKNGIVWLGTGGYGIIKYDSHASQFNNYDIGSIYCLNFDNDNLLSYFLQYGEVHIFDLKTRNPPQRLIPATLWGKGWKIEDVTGIVTDKYGNYWMVVNEGGEATMLTNPTCLLKFSPAKQCIEKYLRTRIDTGWRYKSIVKISDDSLWIFGYNNQKEKMIIKYDIQQNRIIAGYKFPVSSGWDDPLFVSCTLQAANGEFWFGTKDMGLFGLNEKNGTWQHYTDNSNDTKGLPSGKILSICFDPQLPNKYMWVGTEGAGFFRFEFATGKCVRFTEKDGLPNNVVYGILADDNGNLWLSTNYGLSCFTPSAVKGSNTENAFRNFTKGNGIQDNEFNRYAYKKLPTGELVFGGINGITWFKPNEVLKKLPPSPLVLTGFSIFNRPVSYLTDSNIISSPVNYADKIVLPFNQNMFTISFSVLEYSPGKEKKYKYFLENFDKQWINNGSKNEATYTNLNPGTYIFHVVGAGSDGIWGDNEKTITIIITPPWWATWWFRALAIFAGAGIIYAVYYYRLKQAMHVQNLRNRIASDLHDEIGSTLSSISLSSTLIQKKLAGGVTEVMPLLNNISTNTDNMMEAMSDIVWAINTKNDRFDNITVRMRGFAAEILEAKNCALQINVHENALDLKLDMQKRKNLYLIFKEAINNAAKHSGCKNVWVDIGVYQANMLVMVIKDNGKGFKQPAGKITGTTVNGGNGLQNMYKRAAELKGTMKVVSAPGFGTEIRLEFTI